MRIIVAGGQGQVGSALAQLGSEKGIDLIALEKAEFAITDTFSITSVFDKYQPDLLINAAAYTAVDRAESESDLAYAVNETGTALLAEICEEKKIPMLHISTDYVFDGNKKGLYTEEDAVNPLGVYAKSKVAGEQALRERLKQHIILRTSWVFGTEGNNFLKTMIGLASERKSLTVVDDQFGGPTSAKGIAEALLFIAGQIEQAGAFEWGTYHYCQKPYVSWYQFAESIINSAVKLGVLDERVEVLPISSSQFPFTVKRPSNSRLDTSKMKSVFGYSDSNWLVDVETALSSSKCLVSDEA